TRSKRDWSSDVCSSDLGGDRPEPLDVLAPLSAGAPAVLTRGRGPARHRAQGLPARARQGPGDDGAGPLPDRVGRREPGAAGPPRSEERRVGKEWRVERG